MNMSEKVSCPCSLIRRILRSMGDRPCSRGSWLLPSSSSISLLSISRLSSRSLNLLCRRRGTDWCMEARQHSKKVASNAYKQTTFFTRTTVCIHISPNTSELSTTPVVLDYNIVNPNAFSVPPVAHNVFSIVLFLGLMCHPWHFRAIIWGYSTTDWVHVNFIACLLNSIYTLYMQSIT